MATVPRVRKMYIDVSEKLEKQSYAGVLITPSKEHFTDTKSLMRVGGTEMQDQDVHKYLCEYLSSRRSYVPNTVLFPELIKIQWEMLLAIAHFSVEEGRRIDPRVVNLAIKWEGNEHVQTKLINKLFRSKTFMLGHDQRWLTLLEDEYLNVLQEYEFRHAVVGLGFWRHGARPDRLPEEDTPLHRLLFGQFDYASSTLPGDPDYEFGDVDQSSGYVPMPHPMETGGWAFL